ncbi:MAG: helix-turn-helix transcriptional regulator [Candidatus Aminicenantes bacterium]|nr:helix-turn-helix transcriptional regulator [Candidatus Aminicenantes bacterium]
MPIDERFLEHYALMCKAVSKPDRLRIINLLDNKKFNVGQIQEKLDISLSSLSNHLNDMYKMGVLGKEKEGKSVFYYLVNPDLVDGISNMQRIIRVMFEGRTS